MLTEIIMIESLNKENMRKIKNVQQQQEERQRPKNEVTKQFESILDNHHKENTKILLNRSQYGHQE